MTVRCIFSSSISTSLCLTSTCRLQSGTQGSGVSSCSRGVDQRKRCHEVTAVKSRLDHLLGYFRNIKMLCYIAGPRQRTSSTLSSEVSSVRTTTPPIFPADSPASRTSTWPPSAACSTTASSTRFSRVALRCSTSLRSGRKAAVLACCRLLQLRRTKAKSDHGDKDGLQQVIMEQYMFYRKCILA